MGRNHASSGIENEVVGLRFLRHIVVMPHTQPNKQCPIKMSAIDAAALGPFKK